MLVAKYDQRKKEVRGGIRTELEGERRIIKGEERYGEGGGIKRGREGEGGIRKKAGGKSSEVREWKEDKEES